MAAIITGGPRFSERARARAHNKRRVYNRVSEIRSEGCRARGSFRPESPAGLRLIKLGHDRAELEILNFPAPRAPRAGVVIKARHERSMQDGVLELFRTENAGSALFVCFPFARS